MMRRLALLPLALLLAVSPASARPHKRSKPTKPPVTTTTTVAPPTTTTEAPTTTTEVPTTTSTVAPGTTTTVAPSSTTTSTAAPTTTTAPTSTSSTTRPPATTTTSSTTTAAPTTTTSTSTTTTTAPPATTTTAPPLRGVPLIDYTGSGVSLTRWAAGLRQDQPFDGVVLGGNADGNPWTCTPPAIDTGTRRALAAGLLVQGRYTRNLLHVWTLPSASFSWGNQACVDALVAGFSELADTASTGGVDLIVDTETYGLPNPWTSTSQAATWTLIGQRLATRGIAVTFTLGRSGYDADRSFYAGMPSIITALRAGGATVGDGNLYGYWYRPGDYANAASRLRSEQPGMGVNQPAAVDYSPDLTGSVREALRNSDRFAWVYSESVAGRYWWDGTMPASIDAAVRAGRAQA